MYNKLQCRNAYTYVCVSIDMSVYVSEHIKHIKHFTTSCPKMHPSTLCDIDTYLQFTPSSNLTFSYAFFFHLRSYEAFGDADDRKRLTKIVRILEDILGKRSHLRVLVYDSSSMSCTSIVILIETGRPSSRDIILLLTAHCVPLVFVLQRSLRWTHGTSLYRRSIP